MKIGIAPGQRFYELGMGACGDVVRHAEQLGFDAIWVTDHVAPCEQLPGTYPYRADGSAPFGPGAPWHDPFVLMSFLAAATTRMRIGHLLRRRERSCTDSGAIRDYAGLGVDHLWLTPWADDTSPRTISSMKQTLDQCAERFISAHQN